MGKIFLKNNLAMCTNYIKIVSCTSNSTFRTLSRHSDIYFKMFAMVTFKSKNLKQNFSRNRGLFQHILL